MDRICRGLVPFFFLTVTGIRAHEGMWLPTLLQAIEGHMRTEGMMISAEDIYSLNQGSLKDAIVLFGGGCTAEVISDQGLILTNHHCGFSAIQGHSSVEHDYLKNGFWAATRADELANQGLTASFIVRMEDVTARVLGAVGAGMTEAQRTAAIVREGTAVAEEAKQGTAYNAVVRPFNYGNSYYLIVSETFRDVRLVGAPPGSIGNFGGDTDNWMWPRHTGDFSMFRIYASAENTPADFALTNVPFKPRRSLAISMDGVKEGDFAMIFGFPGNTQRYLSSYAVNYVMNTQDPLRISMRRASLGVMDAAMLSSDRTRIQYASKQKSISNSYKKWIGEVRGLKELDALNTKLTFEAEYRKRATAQGRQSFLASLDSLEAIYRTFTPFAKARDLHSEFYGVGPEILRFAGGFGALVNDYDTLVKHDKLEAELTRLRKSARAFYKDYDPVVDREIFKALFEIYRSNAESQLAPAWVVSLGGNVRASTESVVDRLYDQSVFDDSTAVFSMLDKFSKKTRKKLSQDLAFHLSTAFQTTYAKKIKPAVDAMGERISVHMRTYVQGQMELFPEKTFWPDANSTLRLSYGHVEGSDPRDGVSYTPFTTLDGAVAKYIPGDAEFDLPKELLDLHTRRDYAPYGTATGMPVCFTSSLHTTGGNSGSPVLNGRGELIGLNFDRTWESTMSDIQFDPAKCRNIAVDIRYVLFVVDKVCGAHQLIDEMKLVHHVDEPRTIELPIHR